MHAITSFWHFLVPFWVPGMPIVEYAQNTLVRWVMYFFVGLFFLGLFQAALSRETMKNVLLGCPLLFVITVGGILGTQIGVNYGLNWVSASALSVDPRTPVLAFNGTINHKPLSDYLFRGRRENDSIISLQGDPEVHRNQVCDVSEPLDGRAKTNTSMQLRFATDAENVGRTHERYAFNRVYLSNRPEHGVSGILSSSTEVYIPSFRADCFQGYRMGREQRGALYRVSLGYVPHIWTDVPGFW